MAFVFLDLKAGDDHLTSRSLSSLVIYHHLLFIAWERHIFLFLAAMVLKLEGSLERLSPTSDFFLVGTRGLEWPSLSPTSTRNTGYWQALVHSASLTLSKLLYPRISSPYVPSYYMFFPLRFSIFPIICFLNLLSYGKKICFFP